MITANPNIPRKQKNVAEDFQEYDKLRKRMLEIKIFKTRSNADRNMRTNISLIIKFQSYK